VEYQICKGILIIQGHGIPIVTEFAHLQRTPIIRRIPDITGITIIPLISQIPRTPTIPGIPT